MADLAGAFIAMPGGLGTFEEFFEAVTWTQLGLQRKACGALNVGGYYDGLFALADRAVADGFLSSEHRRMLLTEDRPDKLLDLVAAYTPPFVDKWAKYAVHGAASTHGTKCSSSDKKASTVQAKKSGPCPKFETTS
jgi:predicted Rossmann-fold nucleotide-binding protein